MGFGSVVVVATVAALFVLQGISFLCRPRRHQRLFGILTIALASLGILCYVLLVTGTLVVSPEFRIVMVEGSPARLGLMLVIVFGATGGGLAWHAVRLARRRLSAGWILTGTGFLVGLLAISRLRVLTPRDAEPFRIYSYDLWWPPLVVWLTLCAGGAILTLVLSRNVARRYWTAAMPAAVFGLLALTVPEFSDPTSRLLWAVTLWLLLCGNAAWATRLAYPLFRRGLALPARWETRGRFWLPAAVFVSGFILSCPLVWGFRDPLLLEAAVRGLRLIWMIWPAVIALVTLKALYAAMRSGKLARPRWRPPNARQTLAILAALAILLCLGDLFFIFQHEPATAFTLLLVAWLLLVETLGGGAMSMAFSAMAAAGRKGVHAGRSLVAFARGLTAGSPKEERSAQSWPGALLKVLVGVLVLIAVSELPGAGKTIILPFESVKSDPEQKDHPDLGRLVTARVVDAVGELRVQMRPDVLVGKPSMSGGSVHPRFLLAEPAAANATVGRENNVDIGPVKIPVDLLTAPIRHPVRKLFGGRTVRGIVQQHDRACTLLATSSDGETWSVTLPSPPTPAPSPADLTEATTELTQELAFKMIASEPGMVTSGITRSWPAFRLFRRGLAEWERVKSNVNAIEDAIENFRQAIEVDQDFALAHYRLGLALQTDRQPARAIEAFRKSLAANPQFAAAYIALANALYYFDKYYPEVTPATPQYIRSTRAAQEARAEEARIQWQRVLGLPHSAVSRYDRASAYLGLCVATLEWTEREPQYLSYFYCKRAEGLLVSLPPAVRQTAAIQEAMVIVRDGLGVALDRTGRSVRSDPDGTWSCRDQPIDESTLPPIDASTLSSIDESTLWPRDPEIKRQLLTSPYARAAQRYYQRALELSPDDVTVRCNLAVSALGSGDKEPMEALQTVAAAHLGLAEAFSERGAAAIDGRLAAGYYRLALRAYRDAIGLDPNLVAGLNGYAYTFWRWKYQWPDSKWGPEAEVAELAERSARAALRAASSGNEETVVRARSTLGEVLLAGARPHEAIEELERALGQSCTLADSAEDLAEAAGHPCRHVRDKPQDRGRWRISAFDEIRWDLAQAYICAATRDGVDIHRPRLSGSEYLYGRASTLLEQIRINERDREYRPFSDIPSQLDPVGLETNVCTHPNGATDPAAGDAPLFVLKGGNIHYESRHPCTWLGVAAQVIDPVADPRVANYQLHLWGGGVDRRVDLVAGRAAESVLLTARPRRTHDYYFAQLENKFGRVSAVSPLETFANDAASRCSRNLMRLAYVPASSADAAAPTRTTRAASQGDVARR
jgi:tetratricopeptide (TPR) repeat protein